MTLLVATLGDAGNRGHKGPMRLRSPRGRIKLRAAFFSFRDGSSHKLKSRLHFGFWELKKSNVAGGPFFYIGSENLLRRI